MATRTLGLGRVFSAPSDRPPIAVPFWNGLFSALGAITIAIAATITFMVVALYAVVLATGRMPSTAPGHLLTSLAGVVFYGASGWFAWRRMRALGMSPFQPIVRAELTVSVILHAINNALGALVLISASLRA